MTEEKDGVNVVYLPSQPTDTVNDEYIGDSVYVGQLTQWPQALVLTTRNGLPTDPSNTIILDPDVLEQLIRYAKAKGILT